MKKLLTLLLVLLCIFTVSSCRKNPEIDVAPSPNVPDSPRSDIPAYENNELSSGRGWFGDLPNGLRPILMVNGKLYRWTGLSQKYHSSPDGTIYTMGDASSFIPDGYYEIGKISSITEDVPSEEMQLRAAFEASGTVFANTNTPEVVYVQMTTAWLDNAYIRFVSDDLLDNECIFYGGQQYRYRPGSYDICPRITELPEGSRLLGTLTYIGTDTIPDNDLETNRISGSFGYPTDGKEVYSDPNDSNIIYVYEHYYWSKGDYPAWRVCKSPSE